MNGLLHRLTVWRACLSIPNLLASADERSVVSAISAINAAIVILTISGLAWALDMPFVYPALGPTAFILFASPFSRAAAPRSIIIGHGSAIVCGWVSWHVVSFVSGQAVSPTTQGAPLLVSASLALALTCILLVRLRCPHAPACASALIVAVGAAGDWLAVLGMAVGVVLITAEAVLISRLAGVNVPLWLPRPRISPAASFPVDSLAG